MDERELVERIRKAGRGPARPGLVLGIGDDCAVFRPAVGEDLLFTTDLTVEGAHFTREAHTPAVVGHRTLARGLSDIAAMGGRPRFCLVSLALAPWTDRRWLDAFYRGLLRLAKRTGTALAGGDLSRANLTTCDIVVCGSVPRGKALRRDGARPGDGIWVSGSLGGSAVGLLTGAGAAWKKHAYPEPRLAIGESLRGRATAAMDLSDGLSLDLARLCEASGVAADLDESAIPVFRGATLSQALHGGEDYELLFTARPGARVPAKIDGVPLTRVGTIREGRAGAVTIGGRRLEALGWDPFRKSRRARRTRGVAPEPA